jgi:hypothetical protein
VRRDQRTAPLPFPRCDFKKCTAVSRWCTQDFTPLLRLQTLTGDLGETVTRYSGDVVIVSRVTKVHATGFTLPARGSSR